MDVQVMQTSADAQILALSGRVDAGAVYHLSSTTLDGMWNATTEQLIVDLSRVTYLDSSGVALFVRLYQTARAKGQLMKVVRPIMESTRRITRMMQLDRLFPIYDSADLALIN